MIQKGNLQRRPASPLSSAARILRRRWRKRASSFRAIRLSKLSFEEMSSNKPIPELFERTTKATLGSVDAFLSHSWHDDAAAKWAALTSWCADFERAHGREPLLW